MQGGSETQVVQSGGTQVDGQSAQILHQGQRQRTGPGQPLAGGLLRGDELVLRGVQAEGQGSQRLHGLFVELASDMLELAFLADQESAYEAGARCAEAPEGLQGLG